MTSTGPACRDRERSFQLVSVVSLKWQEASTLGISIKHWLQCSQGIPGLIYSCVLLLNRKTGACSWALWQLGMFCSTEKSGSRQVGLFSSYLPRTCYPEFTVMVGVGGGTLGSLRSGRSSPGARHSFWRAVEDTLRFLSKETCKDNILRKKEKSNFTTHFSGRGMKKKMFYLGLLHNRINIFLLIFFLLSTVRTWVAYSF